MIVAVGLVALGVALTCRAVLDRCDQRRCLHAFFARDEGPSRRGWRRRAATATSAVGAHPLVGGGALVGIVAVSGSVVVALAGAAAATVASVAISRSRRRRRAQAARAQLADCLASLAAAMRTGSTLQRALRELAATAADPLGPHLRQVAAEVELGVPVSDALAVLADQPGCQEVTWLAHLVALNTSTGAPLATLLQDTADVIRRRLEVTNEVMALTAEGRMSSWVLAALPVMLVVAIDALQPSYLDRFSSGAGLVTAVAMTGSVTLGIVVINRLVASVEA